MSVAAGALESAHEFLCKAARRTPHQAYPYSDSSAGRYALGHYAGVSEAAIENLGSNTLTFVFTFEGSRVTFEIAQLKEGIYSVRPLAHLIECPAPGCKTMVELDDLVGQTAHMKASHPDILAARAAEDRHWDGWEQD